MGISLAATWLSLTDSIIASCNTSMTGDRGVAACLGGKGATCSPLLLTYHTHLSCAEIQLASTIYTTFSLVAASRSLSSTRCTASTGSCSHCCRYILLVQASSRLLNVSQTRRCAFCGAAGRQDTCAGRGSRGVCWFLPHTVHDTHNTRGHLSPRVSTSAQGRHSTAQAVAGQRNTSARPPCLWTVAAVPRQIRSGQVGRTSVRAANASPSCSPGGRCSMDSAVFQLMLRLSMVSSRCLQASTHTRSWYLRAGTTAARRRKLEVFRPSRLSRRRPAV